MKLTISVAESCTGGRVGDKITNIPGSSDYFLGGITGYSNGAKMALLSVSQESLKSFGAVSEQVAREMAIGCRRAFESDIAVSTTGIVGPSGGSEEKPVGLVWFAVTDGVRTESNSIIFPGDRKKIKESAAIHALQLLLEFIDSG